MNKSFLAVIPLFCILLGGCGPEKEIPWDWYARADSSALGSGISSWNMRLGETGVRCMCAGGEGSTEEHTGFFVQDRGETFVVVKAPRGYQDTIGRSFKWKRPTS